MYISLFAAVLRSKIQGRSDDKIIASTIVLCNTFFIRENLANLIINYKKQLVNNKSIILNYIRNNIMTIVNRYRYSNNLW